MGFQDGHADGAAAAGVGAALAIVVPGEAAVRIGGDAGVVGPVSAEKQVQEPALGHFRAWSSYPSIVSK